ncbi:unnamed protein product [Clonostachys rosea]|uniref:Uncharacterized protein n=1 Tax=Bionectria ochroleuca TaxID=29856 RepID=A0ABY6U2A6_BIOOC|nr:unnamed protein product [Clonostachys rosea]
MQAKKRTYVGIRIAMSIITVPVLPPMYQRINVAMPSVLQPAFDEIQESERIGANKPMPLKILEEQTIVSEKNQRKRVLLCKKMREL